MSSHFDLDIVTFTVVTSGNNPTPIWTAPAWPTGTTYRATVAGHETTLLANANYRHFELLGTFYTNFEAALLHTNTEVAAGGTGGAAGWAAEFVNVGNIPTLEVAGGGGTDVMWAVSLQTIVVRK